MKITFQFTQAALFGLSGAPAGIDSAASARAYARMVREAVVSAYRAGGVLEVRCFEAAETRTTVEAGPADFDTRTDDPADVRATVEALAEAVHVGGGWVRGEGVGE